MVYLRTVFVICLCVLGTYALNSSLFVLI